MSSHNELLKEIEEHLEKLASAHTVLSDAIENEKRAGLITAALSAEKALAPHIAKAKAFAKPATDRIAAATTNEKRVAGGVALTGAFVAGRATAGSGQNKQANALIPTTPTPAEPPRSERLAAVKAILEKHKVPLLVGGLTVGGLGLGYAANKYNVEKQASDQDQEQYSPHYLRNAVLTGGVLAAPDMSRAYSSTAKGLDHRETFHEHSTLSKRYLAEGDLINAAKYANSANKHKALAHEAELYTHNLGGSIGKRFAAGAALATAATGVNHIMHRGEEQTKSASLKAILQALETC